MSFWTGNLYIVLGEKKQAPDTWLIKVSIIASLRSRAQAVYIMCRATSKRYQSAIFYNNSYSCVSRFGTSEYTHCYPNFMGYY